MRDFKLISADSHLNEPPAAWERVQKQYGDRAPKVVKNPPGVAKGTWIITEGLPPIGCSHFSIGIVVGKDSGISEVDLEKHADTVHFMENFRFEDYPAAWEPSARIEAQDRDGVEAEVLFPALHAISMASPTNLYNGPSFILTMPGCTSFAATVQGGWWA